MAGFDHHTEAFALDWRGEYARWRETDPVARTDAHGGFVVPTRYDDIRRVLLTPESFVCRREVPMPDGAPAVAGGVTIPINPFRMGMMEMDPPDSTFFRSILVPWFSAKAVEAAEPHLRELAGWCLDRVIEQGHLDIVDDLANPLPALITLDLLGLPMTNWHEYGVVLHQAAYREKGSAKRVAWLQEDLRSVLAGRRDDPPEIRTPVDALLAAERDGVRLPLETAAEMVFMLLTGGIDTSTGLIAAGLRHLCAHRDQFDRLRTEPERIPAAVDEMLRYFTPGTSVARTVIEAAEIGGCPVAAGERIFLGLGAANMDPAEFDDPTTLDIDRNAGRHLAFGAGRHRCLGAFLAKTEMVVVLQEVLRRLPDLAVDESGVEPYPTIPMISGYRAMPATFTADRPEHPVTGDDAPPPRADRLRRAAAQLADDERGTLEETDTVGTGGATR